MGLEIKRNGECSWIASDLPSFIFKEDPPEADFMENEDEGSDEKAKEEPEE